MTYTHQQMDDDPDFAAFTSSSSTSVDDVQSITFGGTNARFWMLRKHVNSMSRDELKYLPFYSWQCLTLHLSHRDVDLIISDEKDMNKFLIFIIHQMYTIDGFRGSATTLLDKL